MALTDEMIEDLKKMWQEGLTTGEIGKRLNVSKNSIVGKVHRLGLSGRPSPIKKKAPEQQDKTAEKKPATAPKAKAQEPKVAEQKTKAPAKEKASAPVEEKSVIHITPQPKVESPHHHNHNLSLTELDNHTCRWPIGDPKDDNFHFCGKKVRIGQTYCDEHSAIAYVRPNKK